MSIGPRDDTKLAILRMLDNAAAPHPEVKAYHATAAVLEMAQDGWVELGEGVFPRVTPAGKRALDLCFAARKTDREDSA